MYISYTADINFNKVEFSGNERNENGADRFCPISVVGDRGNTYLSGRGDPCLHII